MTYRIWLSQVLVMTLMAPLLAEAAQAVNAQTVPTGPTRNTLRVIVLEGEGAMNNLEARIYAPLVVEVRDENDKPIEGAKVTFQLPATGPGGFFSGQQLTKVTTTTLAGQAAASGFIANNQAGRYTVRVTVTSGDRTGEVIVNQTNALRITDGDLKSKSALHRWGWRKIAIIGGVVAGGIIVAVLVTRGSSKDTVTITPGTVTIGGR